MAQPAVFRGQRVWLLDAPGCPHATAPDLLITSAAGSRLRQVAAFADREPELRRLLLADGTPAAPSCGPLAAWGAELDSLAPGPELWATLGRRPDRCTAAADPTTAIRGPAAVFADAILDGVVARRRLMAALDAHEARDLAALTAASPGIDQFLPTEVGLALHLSDAKAGRLLDRAHRLVHTLPATTEALARGQISSDSADALVNATATSTPDVAARVEAAVLPRCPGRSYAETHRAATYRVTKWDADAVRKRHRKAVEERHVATRPLGDGMAEMSITSTVADIAAIWETLTGLADAAKTPGDVRTLGARRVDVLVDLCTDILEGRLTTTDFGAAAVLGGRQANGERAGGAHEEAAEADGPEPDGPELDGPEPDGRWGGCRCGGCTCPPPRRERRLSRRHGRRPRIQVVVPLSTLLGGDAPAELLGHGWISPDQARLLAADGELTRLVCDPLTGIVIDLGRTVYRPPQNLVDLVLARDRTCIMPGCRQPSWRSENDHLIRARPDPRTGKPTLGTTGDTNLGPACKHHHLAKDADRGFSVTRNPDGSYTWTTPLARTYTRPPDDQLGEPDYAASARTIIEAVASSSPEQEKSPAWGNQVLTGGQAGAEVGSPAHDHPADDRTAEDRPADDRPADDRPADDRTAHDPEDPPF